jgi:hypothetical protein
MTVIVCDAVVLFPHASVAVQVRVMVYSWAHAPAMVLSVYPKVGFAVAVIAYCGRGENHVPFASYRVACPYTGNHRCQSIDYRYRLGCGATVLACICGGPGTGDGVLLGTCSGYGIVRVPEGWIAVAVIAYSGIAEYRC